MDIDIQALARQIAVRMDPQALMDAEDVAAFLKCSPRYVLEDYAKAPGFPKPLRLTGPEGRRGNARWKREDIQTWVDSHVEVPQRKPGRRRNTPEVATV